MPEQTLCLIIVHNIIGEKKEIALTKKETDMVLNLIEFGRNIKGGQALVIFHNGEPQKIKEREREFILGQKNERKIAEENT